QHKSSRSDLQSFLFFTVISGSGVLIYEGQEYKLRQSDCVFIYCDKPYIHQTDENDLWTLRWIHFYGPALPSIYRKYCERGGRPVFRPSMDDKFQAITGIHDDLMAIAKSDDYMRDMLINQHLSALLTIIMSESWHPEDQEEMPKKRSVLLPIKEYLDSNYALKITLDDLAERFFINKYYLAKSFKEQYGVSVNNYLLSVRITKAKQLLRFSDKSIEQIGLECGLGQAHYFSSKFKEIEGVPPSIYREQW
ncbi:MAG: AraC family transcriptional regulator, partial [Butyrivibrio sp.]|nr:AraC family transcriptional regulator [Butyrivibrio sp.]